MSDSTQSGTPFPPEVVASILQKLDELSSLKTDIAVISVRLADLDVLKKAVKGNGKPGLEDRMTEVENQLKTHFVTCPVAPKLHVLEAAVKSLQEDKLEAKKTATEKQEKEKAEEDERKKELRVWKLSLFGSIIVLFFSTLVNILVK